MWRCWVTVQSCWLTPQTDRKTLLVASRYVIFTTNSVTGFVIPARYAEWFLRKCIAKTLCLTDKGEWQLSDLSWSRTRPPSRDVSRDAGSLLIRLRDTIKGTLNLLASAWDKKRGRIDRYRLSCTLIVWRLLRVTCKMNNPVDRDFIWLYMYICTYGIREFSWWSYFLFYAFFSLECSHFKNCHTNGWAAASVGIAIMCFWTNYVLLM